MTMGPDIDWGWNAGNDVAELRRQYEAIIKALAARIERLERLMEHICPDKSDDV